MSRRLSPRKRLAAGFVIAAVVPRQKLVAASSAFAGVARRTWRATAFAIAAVVVPAVPLLVVYFVGANDEPCTGPNEIRYFTLLFPPITAAFLSYRALVLASPRLREGHTA